MKCRIGYLWLLRRLLVSLILVWLFSAMATAQGWKDELKAEKTKNVAQLAAIRSQAEPISAELHRTDEQIARHNAHQCVAPADDSEACAGYDREAHELNTTHENLIAQLTPLADQEDRLIARNKHLDRLLRCVPLPTACKSNADCNECSSCGSFDGTTGTGICQPRP